MFSARTPGRPRLPGRLASARRRVRFGPLVEGLEQRMVLTYLAPVSYATGINPAGATIGRFNADAAPDIAIINPGAPLPVSILLGDGLGSFAAKVDYAAGPGAVDAKAGDFNGDGKEDLAVVGTSGTVSLLLGKGDGSFAAPVANPVGVGSHSINVGDFNRDGKLDIATMNSGTASVLLGNGDGTFQAHKRRGHPRQLDRRRRRRLQPRRQARPGHFQHRQPRHDHGPPGPRRRDSFDPATELRRLLGPGLPRLGRLQPRRLRRLRRRQLLRRHIHERHPQQRRRDLCPARRPTGSTETGYEIEAGDFNGDGNKDFAVRGGSPTSWSNWARGTARSTPR